MAASFEIVRHEPAGVARDGRVVLAEADAGSAPGQDPRCDHRVLVAGAGEWGVLLEHRALAPVASAREQRAAAPPERDVLSLAREDRLPHVLRARERARVAIARQQVRM